MKLPSPWPQCCHARPFRSRFSSSMSSLRITPSTKKTYCNPYLLLHLLLLIAVANSPAAASSTVATAIAAGPIRVPAPASTSATAVRMETLIAGQPTLPPQQQSPFPIPSPFTPTTAKITVAIALTQSANTYSHNLDRHVGNHQQQNPRSTMHKQ